MVAKKKLILVPSEKMDSNKKENRNEHILVRMASPARKHMDFNEDSVELWIGQKTAIALNIFQAFSADIKKIKNSGSYTPSELKRIGFVTSETYQKVTGKQPEIEEDSKNVWISKSVKDIMYGADPEFLLFDNNGNVIRANNVLNYSGHLGCDGAMAEIRPIPSPDVLTLVKNMRDIFNNSPEDIQTYNWICACYHKDDVRDYPVGGHIHIGNPAKIASMPTNKREYLFRTMNKILDELLAIPMIKLDGTDDGCARRTKCKMGKYGYFGEYRTCDGRLEHRTLSGMWLLHPSLARAVIGTAKAIVDEIYKFVDKEKYNEEYFFPKELRDHSIWKGSFNRWGEIPLAGDMGCDTPSNRMIELLNASNIASINTPYLNSWYKKLTGMSTYKENRKYIDGLFEILKIPAADLKNWDREIKNNWLSDKKFLVDV